MERAELPRILFVNEWPPDSLYLGDLVRQLLKNYPIDKINWWHCCSPTKREISDFRAAQVFCCNLPSFLNRNRLMPIRGPIIERLWVPLAARHLRKTIDLIKPDVLWVLLARWPVLIAPRVLGAAGPALHVSVWDFPDTAASRQNLGLPRCERMLKAIYGMLRQACSWDAISESMLQELTARTGRQDGILVNSGFEPEHLKILEEFVEDERAQDVVRVAYVGTIISHRSFQVMLKALGSLHGRLTCPIRLEFYGGRNYRSAPWFDSSWMLEHEVLTDEGLVQSLRGCSWGIVVMDLEGEDLRYSRYSFPNKIGTYLSAGVPVLGLGHPTSALAEVFSRYSVGKSTSATELGPLEQFLSEAFRMERPRSFFRENILRCAHERFDAQKMRERVWQAWRQSRLIPLSLATKAR